MSKEERRVPELRFKVFHDDWEQRELKEVASFYNEKRIPIDSIHRQAGKYPYYGATGVIDFVEDYIFEGEYILLAEDGANILTRNSPVSYITKGRFWLNNHAHIMKMKNGSNQFLLELLEKQNYRKFNSGTAQPKLNSKVVKNIQLFYPSSSEQELIGALLKKLNALITLHQRKINIFNKIKQNFMMYLFPKKENLFPELRFIGFYTPWAQRKFFDNIRTIVDFRGKTPKKINMTWSSTGYLALSALNVKNGYIDKTIEANYGSEKLYKKWMGEKHLHKGFVLFTTEAPMGNIALVPDDDGYILSQRTIALDTYEKKMTTLFLATILRSNNVINKLISLSSGATAKGVSQKSLSALNLVVPIDLEEQKSISLLMNSIEKNINIHEKKLKILLKLKQAYLSKMFI